MRKRYEKCGDKELWVLKGTDWEFPVYCQPIRLEEVKRWVVEHAHIPTIEQWDAMRKLLLGFKFDRGRWIILDSLLPNVAYKAQGVTPGYYVKWPGAIQQEPGTFEMEDDVSIPSLNSDASQFINYLWDVYRPCKSKDILEIVWVAAQNAMLDWVTEKRKVLDLGFVRVSSIPYRANWKHFFDVKFRNYEQMFKEKPERRDALLAQTDFHEQILDVNLAEMSMKNSCIGWTLEATPTERYDDKIEDTESTRRASRGDREYAEYYQGLLERHKNLALEVYSSYVQRRCRPVAKVGKSVNGLGVALLPDNSKTRMRPDYSDSGVSRVEEVPATETWKLIPTIGGGKIEGVPKLSALRKRASHMRKTR